MDQASTYALLAAGAYWDVRGELRNRAPNPPGWKVLEEFTVSSSGGRATALGSGFSARVYQGPDGEIVISYAGTEGGGSMAGLINDFLAGNFPLANGGDGSQAHEAALLYERVQTRFGAAANINFTGHSLGGGLAGLMAVWFNRPAIVFDPAPFEASALDVGVGSAMTSVRSDLIGRGINDAQFRDYLPSRDFSTRESRVVSYAVDGEILQVQAPVSLLPRIEGSRVSKLVSGAPDLSSGDKHSIDLLAAVLLNSAFETAAKALPTALPLLFNTALYGLAPMGAQQNLLVKLVRGEVGIYDDLTGIQSVASTNLLTKFTADIGQLVSTDGMVAQSSVQTGLLVAAMEYYYFKDAVSASALFSTGGNGVHFKFSDSGATISKALPRLVNAINGYLGNDELRALGAITDRAQVRDEIGTGRLMSQDAWHLQTGAAGMIWTASGNDKDAAVGGAQTDILDGGAGDDILIGGAGRDFLSGGADRDTLIGGVDVDVLDGGTGDDLLMGGQGADVYTFNGAFGDDTVQDSDGQGAITIGGTTLTGGKKVSPGVYTAAAITYTIVNLGTSFNLVITPDGSANRITVRGWVNTQLGITLDEAPAAVTPTTNTYTGGAAHANQDRLFGSAGADLMLGLDGNDLIIGLSGDDVIDAGLGDDLLLGGLGADTIQGGAGADWIFGSGWGDVGSLVDPAPVPAGGSTIASGYGWVVYNDVNGTPTVSQVSATALAGDAGNVIDGGAGDDHIDAGTGNDVAHGGDDNDMIYGLSGNDLLFGDAGNDVIFGDGVVRAGTLQSVRGDQHGNDVLVGGAGTDNLFGDGGNDEIYGGDDNDYLYGDQSTLNRGILPQQFDGNDYLDGGAGADWMEGGQRDDTLFGGTGNDTMFGDGAELNEAATFEGKDYLDGGNDVLQGGGNDDELFGGIGDDRLWGDAAGSNSTNQGEDYLDGEADIDDELFGGDADAHTTARARGVPIHGCRLRDAANDEFRRAA